MEVVFHLPKKEVVFHFKLSKPYLTALVYVSCHFETIPGGWVVSGGGSEVEIRLAQSSWSWSWD